MFFFKLIILHPIKKAITGTCLAQATGSTLKKEEYQRK